MILIKHYQNIYLDPIILVDFLRREEHLDYQRLLDSDSEVLEIRFSGDDNEVSLSRFITAFNSLVAKDFSVNRFYASGDLLPAKKTRSRIGLFFDQRKDEFIKRYLSFETEIPVANQSYFIGAVEVTGLLAEQLDGKLPEHCYRFTYGSINTAGDTEDLVPDVLQGVLSTASTKVVVSDHALATSVADGTGYAHQSFFNGQDEGVFRLYAGNATMRKLRLLTDEALPFSERQVTEKVTSDGSERIVTAYLEGQV